MVNTIGTKSTPIFYQNPRSDPKISCQFDTPLIRYKVTDLSSDSKAFESLYSSLNAPLTVKDHLSIFKKLNYLF